MISGQVKLRVGERCNQGDDTSKVLLNTIHPPLEMSQKAETDVLEELFGGSDDENEVVMKIEEEFVENKKKTPIGRTKVTRKKSLEDSNEELVEELDGIFLLKKNKFSNFVLFL